MHWYLRHLANVQRNTPPPPSLFPPPPQGITPTLTLLKEGLISGSPDEKEEAARVLVEVIHLASPKTLSSGKVAESTTCFFHATFIIILSGVREWKYYPIIEDYASLYSAPGSRLALSKWPSIKFTSSATGSRSKKC